MPDPITMKTFGEMGYQLEDFTIPNPDDQGRTFTYYTFSGQGRPEPYDVWEVIGLRRQPDHPQLVDLRWFHLDQDLLEIDGFRALIDSNNAISLSPADLRAFIDFLKQEYALEMLDNLSVRHFHLMSTDELQAHFSPTFVSLREGHTYRYLPSAIIPHQQVYMLIAFPQWTAQYGANQSTVLGCTAFYEEHQHRSPTARALFPKGIQVLTLDRQALIEFVWLLEQSSYEHFVQTVQR